MSLPPGLLLGCLGLGLLAGHARPRARSGTLISCST